MQNHLSYLNEQGIRQAQEKSAGMHILTNPMITWYTLYRIRWQSEQPNRLQAYSVR